MMRLAVVLASIGVLLLVGSLFMPGHQVVQQGSGWVVAMKNKAGELMSSVVERKFESAKPVAIAPANESDGGGPSGAAEVAGKTPTSTEATEINGVGTNEFGESDQALSAPAGERYRDEVTQLPANHEDVEGTFTGRTPLDVPDEGDAESAAEVLERVGRKIHGKRG